jgi:two-component system, sensor histidine kinase and response regulator
LPKERQALSFVFKFAFCHSLLYISFPCNPFRVEIQKDEFMGRPEEAIDRAAIAGLREQTGDAQMFGSIISQYLEDVPPHLAALREAADLGNAETVRKEAHLLKGATSNFSARKMQSLCSQLEELGRSGSLPQAQNLVQALEQEFIRVRAALQAELEKAA